MGYLVAQLPHAQSRAPWARWALNHAIFRLAKYVESPLNEEIERKRKSSDTIGENPVANVPAGCVVASQGRRLLPGLAAAARVLVVPVRKRLMPRDPKSLDKEKCEEPGRDALRQVEAETSVQAKGTTHLVRQQWFQSKCWRPEPA